MEEWHQASKLECVGTTEMQIWALRGKSVIPMADFRRSNQAPTTSILGNHHYNGEAIRSNAGIEMWLRHSVSLSSCTNQFNQIQKSCGVFPAETNQSQQLGAVL
jgi:hypothetical protein